MESLAVVLRRVPLFADLPPGSFAKVIADLREEIVEPGTVVCSEGDLATDFFVIRSGEVLVYVERATGERELVDSIGPNQGFGEAALFHERRRSATIVARTHVELWRLPKDKFTSLIEENPWIILHFTGVVLDRLHAENRQLAQLIQVSRTQADGALAQEPAQDLIAFEALSVLEALETATVAALLGDAADAEALLARLADRGELIKPGKHGAQFIAAVRENLKARLLARVGEDGVRVLHRRAAVVLLGADERASSIDHRLPPLILTRR